MRKALILAVIYTILFIAYTSLLGYNNDRLPYAVALLLFFIGSFTINLILDLIVSKFISIFVKN